MVPVTVRSGKQPVMTFRVACDTPLRYTVDPLAWLSLPRSAWARAYHPQPRARGHRHRRALRALGAKWLKIIFVMWQRQVAYDEQHHLAMMGAAGPAAAGQKNRVTRTRESLGLLARVCFNASPVTAHPTEAQLYRSAARTGGAQLLDEVETLRGDKDRFDALISVLNVGFERGGVVTRIEKRGERFVEEPYEVYAPRVLAGIAGLKDTVEDRSLPLFMLRKRRSEPVARLGRTTEVEAQALRQACGLACLTQIERVVSAYDGAPVPLEREGIDDRAVDPGRR